MYCTLHQIAILIGILGLLGLVSLAVARRTKEIGIRKVLGAGIAHILSLFTREFVLIVCLGFLVAGPVAAYVMQGWLEDFAYRVAIRWDQFAIAFLISLCVMLLVVCIKSYRAATMNPVDAIRDE